MSKAVVVELPNDEPIMVHLYETLDEARADFMGRFEQLTTYGDTVINFDAGANDGEFATAGTRVWFTETA